MLGRMRMPGERDGGPIAEESEQVTCIVRVVGRVLRVEVGAQRDVEGQHDEALLRRRREQVLDEGQLGVREVAAIGALFFAARLAGAGAEIIDVVEHHEQRAGVLVRVVRRPEHPLPGVARARGIGRLVVEVVVAADGPPRQADRAEDPVEAVELGEIVEHQVAAGHAEGGPTADQAADDGIAQILDLRSRFRLRIGDQHDVEAGGLVDAGQLEVDRRRQRACRRQPGVAEAEVLRRARGIVDVGMAHEVGGGIARKAEAGRLDDEDRLAGRDLHAVAAVDARAHDVAPVRDQHARDGRPLRARREAGDDLGDRAGGCRPR